MKPYATTCSECGKPITRANYCAIHFCDLACKGNWQRRAKPVSRDWLQEQYVTLGRDCTQIAAEVKRDPKSVWNWLKDFGIQTRRRGDHAKAGKTGFSPGHKLRVGRKLSDAHRQAIREARKRDGRIPAYVNGVHWSKVYPDRKNGRWKGGITPDRQSFHSSPEWAEAVKSVWKRDDARCRRCGLDHRTLERGSVRFHIHHIDSFAIRERRAVVDNLVLLCWPCHRWVHGKANTEGVLLGSGHKRKRLGVDQR